jgi:DNA modification methylase
MCGDSLSEADVTKLMDGKIAKLCATDPPYLVSYDANNHPSKGFSGKNKDWKGRYADKHKNEPLGPFYEGFLKLALGVLESNAATYIWHASVRQAEVERAMQNCGLIVHQQIIWVKNKPVLGYSFYMWKHEPCFFGWKQGSKPARKSGSFPATVWEVDVPVLPAKNRAILPKSRLSCSRTRCCSIRTRATFATNRSLAQGLRYALPRRLAGAALRWSLTLDSLLSRSNVCPKWA